MPEMRSPAWTPSLRSPFASRFTRELSSRKVRVRPPGSSTSASLSPRVMAWTVRRSGIWSATVESLVTARVEADQQRDAENAPHERQAHNDRGDDREDPAPNRTAEDADDSNYRGGGNERRHDHENNRAEPDVRVAVGHVHDEIKHAEERVDNCPDDQHDRRPDRDGASPGRRLPLCGCRPGSLRAASAPSRTTPRRTSGPSWRSTSSRRPAWPGRPGAPQLAGPRPWRPPPSPPAQPRGRSRKWHSRCAWPTHTSPRIRARSSRSVGTIHRRHCLSPCQGPQSFRLAGSSSSSWGRVIGWRARMISISFLRPFGGPIKIGRAHV